MRHCLGMACAGVLLLAATGCIGDTFLARQIVVFGPKTIVPGTVADVSAKLRDGLSEAGLLLNTKWVGSDYRITSQWNSRTVFCLHLRQTKNDGGIKTMVRMQWDRGGDEELWQLILKILNAPAADGADAPTEK
jgi:hypothetical protein